VTEQAHCRNWCADCQAPGYEKTSAPRDAAKETPTADSKWRSECHARQAEGLADWKSGDFNPKA
jgi:hypothetical protein